MPRLALRSVVVGLMASLIGATPVVAGEPSPPALDSRIRVTAPGVLGKRVVGRLMAFDADSLKLQPEGARETLEVPRAAITRLEVSRRPARRGHGAVMGLLGGLGAAAVIGVMAGHSCAPGAWLCFDRSDTAAMAAVLTVPLGVLVGIGAAPGERWEIYKGQR